MKSSDLNTDGSLSEQPSSAIMPRPPRLAVVGDAPQLRQEKRRSSRFQQAILEVTVWKLWVPDDVPPGSSTWLVCIGTRNTLHEVKRKP